VTTLPAPISALSPILTPGRIIAPRPIHTLRPMRIGRPNSNPEALLTASQWVIGGEDLNPWPDPRLFTNDDLYDIEDHAVEVQEHTRTETDVEALVAVKR
jgi:hypothetical protein